MTHAARSKPKKPRRTLPPVVQFRLPSGRVVDAAVTSCSCGNWWTTGERVCARCGCFVGALRRRTG